MLAGQVRLNQVTDSWLVVASVWEERDGSPERDYSQATYQMPLTDAEHQMDALSALQSALGRWLAVTSR